MTVIVGPEEVRHLGCEGAYFKTIGEAMDFLNSRETGESNTIIVYPGKYKERIDE